MRILQMISSLASGGAEKFVVNLSNQLLEMGHEIIVCTMNDNPSTNFNKQFLDRRIEYHSLKIRGKSMGHILRLSWNYIDKCNPDVIHCHLAVLQYIVPVCIKRHIKVFHTIHSLTQYASGGGGWRAKLFKVLYQTNMVTPVTISEVCHKSFFEYYHLNNDYVIENGVPMIKKTYSFDYARNKVGTLKANKTTPVFIHVARFHEAKNQNMLIDVFNKLAKNGLDFTLLVIGRGFDAGEGKKIKDSACSNIHFLGEKTNVGDYLFCSDYFCLTSIYEGLPISLLEAMSCGVIPICTPVGGMLNVIQDGKNGFLSPEITIDSYLSTVIRAIENRSLLESIIKSYKDKYSMELCAEKYMELYTSTKRLEEIESKEKILKTISSLAK